MTRSRTAAAASSSAEARTVGQVQHAGGDVDRDRRRLLGQASHRTDPREQAVIDREHRERPGRSARRWAAEGRSSPWAGVPRLIRRASIATRAGSAEPAPFTASSAAWTAGNGSLRWSSRTSMRARVPPASPNLRRARAQNCSWAAVSTPALAGLVGRERARHRAGLARRGSRDSGRGPGSGCPGRCSARGRRRRSRRRRPRSGCRRCAP